MQTHLLNKRKLAALLLVIASLFIAGLYHGEALAAPTQTAATHSPSLALPASSACTSPSTGVSSCNLWAVTGTIGLPNASITIWGYSDSPIGSATLPGPILIVNEGDTVTVNLTNYLSEDTALLFPGQDMLPDLTGAAANGGSKSYTFTASRPGTYLYEAGLLSNAQHQVAMGMYGALIVQSATAGQAYSAASTAFDDEALVVLSELDPALNNSANPAAFDMRDYHPTYQLINGQAYPNTTAIAGTAGGRLLLRYVNAGLQAHSMTALGLRQTAIAIDGSPYQYAHSMVAETIAPGQTADAITTIPATAADGSKYALYDGTFTMHNGNASGFGGMLTFIAIGSSAPGGDTTGPAASGLTLSPNPSNGSANVALSASISDAATGGSNVDAAEYFVDSIGANGTGTAMSGAFGSPMVGVNATLSTALLATLSSGNHSVYVHGHDAAGNWGAFNHITLNLDRSGPATSGLTLTPNPSNGTANVALHGTGNDSFSGGSNIGGAEYTIDGGAASAMTVNAASPVASVDATIPAATINALSQGTHTVAVRSRDVLGNWGTPATIGLIVDKTGPTTSNVTAVPNPSNGAIGVNSSTPAVRLNAAVNDALSKISAAEAFIDTVGANGSGIVMIAADGVFNSSVENVTVDIPLTTINALSAGNHTLYVRGKDSSGNWGGTSTLSLLIDKTAPTFTGISLAPNPTNGAPNVTLTVNGASDTGGSGVAGGEYWICSAACADPGQGNGTAFNGLTASITASSLATGNYTVYARIRDAAGNWSTGANGVRSATLTVAANAIFSDGFESGNFSAWSSATPNNNATRLSVTAAAALVGTRGLQAQGNNTNYVQYNFGTAAIPAAPTYDARFYFRPNANSSTGKDIFSAATSNTFGTTLFRVRYRLNGTTPQVQIQVGTANTNATWTNINGGTSNNVIEVVWQAVGSGGPNPGTLQLYVNGALAQTLATTSTGSVGAIRLGSVTSTGANTLMYFDAFASKRQVSPLIGP
jgi:FtsP/CotA-like multicopper oxidase with cupredoxin domain